MPIRRLAQGLTASESTIPCDEESAIPNVGQPHFKIHRRSRRSGDDAVNATHVHSILLVGREAGGVGTGGDVSPSRVTSGPRDYSVGNGDGGREGRAFVLYHRRDGELESRQETRGQAHCDWEEMLPSL